MIERNTKALARQQMVLAALGFYSGKFDGVWSKKTIEAKVDYECSGKFSPALPNRGLPFDTAKPLPVGLYVDASIRDFSAISCADFESKRKDLESQLQLMGEALEKDDQPIGPVGVINVMSEEDLNVHVKPEQKVEPEPYTPGIAEDEPELVTAAPSEVTKTEEVEEDIPADFGGFGVRDQEEPEPTEQGEGTKGSEKPTQQDSKRNKRNRHHRRP